MKKCPVCGGVVKGKSSKVYCSYDCKNKQNNKIAFSKEPLEKDLAILPCPKCGSNLVSLAEGASEIFCQCMDCFNRGESFGGRQNNIKRILQKAIKAWNKNR